MSNIPLTKVYITKYALSKGIQSIYSEICDIQHIRDIATDTFRPFCFHGNEWHRTPEEALARAEEMRQNKIESLKKQLAKLENMTFTIIEDDNDAP